MYGYNIIFNLLEKDDLHITFIKHYKFVGYYFMQILVGDSYYYLDTSNALLKRDRMDINHFQLTISSGFYLCYPVTS